MLLFLKRTTWIANGWSTLFIYSECFKFVMSCVTANCLIKWIPDPCNFALTFDMTLLLSACSLFKYITMLWRRDVQQVVKWGNEIKVMKCPPSAAVMPQLISPSRVSRIIKLAWKCSTALTSHCHFSPTLPAPLYVNQLENKFEDCLFMC